MADITKCSGKDCPLKLDCHRYTAKDALVWQSYFFSPPFDHKLKTCQYIWNDNAEELWKGIERLSKPTN